MFKVIRPGTRVHIGHEFGGHIGVITALTILNNNLVRYCVSWWQDGDHHDEWFEAFEVTPADDDTMNVTYE